MSVKFEGMTLKGTLHIKSEDDAGVYFDVLAGGKAFHLCVTNGAIGLEELEAELNEHGVRPVKRNLYRQKF